MHFFINWSNINSLNFAVCICKEFFGGPKSVLQYAILIPPVCVMLDKNFTLGTSGVPPSQAVLLE